MKLILTNEVPGLGLAGDIVEVADGYGRNYLVPRGNAINWSKGAEKQISQIKRARDTREIRGMDHAREIKDQLEGLQVVLKEYASALKGRGARGYPGRRAHLCTARRAAGGRLLVGHAAGAHRGRMGSADPSRGGKTIHRSQPRA